MLTTTGPVQEIDIVHQHIHEGDYNTISQLGQVAAGGDAEILILAGDTTPHVVFGITPIGNARVWLYQGTTYSGAGAALPIYNNNLNSSKTPTLTAFLAPTITTDGTQKFASVAPAGITTPIIIRGNTEIMLKRNTAHLLRVTNDDAAIKYISLQFGFYEQ